MRGRYKGKKGFFIGATGVAGPGNTSVKKLTLLADGRFVKAVLDFLKSRVGGSRVACYS